MDATVSPPRPARPSSRPTWPIGRTHRKVWLVVHILSGGAWIGIDVLVAVLVGAGTFGPDDATRGLAYQALGTFVAGPMLVSGLLCLVSGLVLGLGSPYGLVRFWWVAVKLVINLLLCTLILVLLMPAMGEVADHGAALSRGRPDGTDVSDLFFPPAVSLTLLSLATVLSVFKPWGRIRRSGRFGGGQRDRGQTLDPR